MYLVRLKVPFAEAGWKPDPAKESLHPKDRMAALFLLRSDSAPSGDDGDRHRDAACGDCGVHDDGDTSYRGCVAGKPDNRGCNTAGRSKNTGGVVGALRNIHRDDRLGGDLRGIPSDAHHGGRLHAVQRLA